MQSNIFKKELNPGRLAPRSIDQGVLKNMQKWDEVSLLKPSVYFAFNYTTQQLEYLSPGIERLTGHSHEEFIAMKEPYMYFFHQEDLPLIIQGVLPKLRMVRRQYAKQIGKLSYQLYGRFLKKDGSCSYAATHFELLDWTEDLYPILSHGSVTELTFLGGFHGVALSVFLQDNGASKIVYQNTFPYENSRVSNRELEVLQHIVDGKTSKEIGEILHISDKTVNNHRQNLLRKLNVRSTSEMVKYAIKQQLI